MRRCKAQPFVAVVALVAATTAWAQGARPFADLLLQVLDIRSGSTVAEVGAGRGDFAFRMAEAVGPKGRVYANEVAQDNVRLDQGAKAVVRQQARCDAEFLVSEVLNPHARQDGE